MARGTPILHVRDFSGGLNLRDAPTELNPRFSPDLYNVSLDERGGVVSRLGYSKYNGVSFGASPPSNLFYYPTGNTLLTQVGASVYQGTSTTPIKTFTTSARCGMCEFVGSAYLIHPVDGLFQWNGAAITALGAGPKGNTIATWQNKLWAAGDPTVGNEARVSFCNAGDPTIWGNFVDVRDKDGTKVVGVGPGIGLDIVGRSGLTIFKARSTHRIYDSATGAYQTIDTTRGVASALAATVVNNKIVLINESGIFESDGVGPLKPVAAQLGPLWDESQINLAQLSLFAAGSVGQRAYFSVPRAGASANSLMLEYHAEEGWVTANSNAASCYATLYGTNQRLYGGSPTVNGQVYQQLTTGADDGTAITGYFRTPWFELANSARARLPRLRVNGRGAFTVSVYKDYSLASPTTRTVSIVPVSSNDAYASDLHTLGTGRSFSVRIDFSSSSAFTAPALLGGATPSVGAVALYALGFYPVPIAVR